MYTVSRRAGASRRGYECLPRLWKIAAGSCGAAGLDREADAAFCRRRRGPDEEHSLEGDAIADLDPFWSRGG